jgi:hypothetical protein
VKPNVSAWRRRGSTYVEVLDERLDVGVAVGPDVRDAAEALAHQLQLLAVRLVGVPRFDLLADHRQVFAVGRDRLPERVADVDPAAVLAQHAGESLQRVEVLLDDDRALAFERVGGHLGRDERVAVAVRPGPRAELEQFGHVDVGVLLVDDVLELLVHLADDVEEDVLDVVLDVSRLVLGLRPAVTDLRRLPEARHLGVDLVPHVLELLVGQPALVDLFEVRRDGAELGFHRLPARLGRVGRERRFDEHVVEDPLDGLGVGVGLGQPLDRLFEPVLERPCLRGLPVGADPLALLGEVDELEVRGERAGDDARAAGVEPVEDVVEVLTRVGLARPVRDRARPKLLYRLERLGRRLVLEDVSEERPEFADVLPDVPRVQFHATGYVAARVKPTSFPRKIASRASSSSVRRFREGDSAETPASGRVRRRVDQTATGPPPSAERRPGPVLRHPFYRRL